MENDSQRLRNSASLWSKGAAGAYPHSDVTKKVIGAAIEVHKILGPGFMEKAYEEALTLELERLKIGYESQRLVRVRFRGAIVDTHKIDLIVEGKVVVELKAVKELEDVHLAVTLAYLKATDLKVGLVINFAETMLRVRRVARGVHDNTETLNFRDAEGEDDEDAAHLLRQVFPLNAGLQDEHDARQSGPVIDRRPSALWTLRTLREQRRNHLP